MAEPLERSFATTLGNSIRRVLLSSLEGAAVTAVKITGAVHELSSNTGVKEDVVDIILNIKKLRVECSRWKADRTIKLRARVKLKAMTFRLIQALRYLILNKLIATLDKRAVFEAEMYIQRRGDMYQPKATRKELPVDMIAVDSVSASQKSEFLG